jgi:hypothetical protein
VWSVSLEKPRKREGYFESAARAERRLADNAARLARNAEKAAALDRGAHTSMLDKIKQFGTELSENWAMRGVGGLTLTAMLKGFAVADPETLQMHIDTDRIIHAAEVGAAVAAIIALVKLGGKALDYVIPDDEEERRRAYRLPPLHKKKHS